jgi:hypothetical protein
MAENCAMDWLRGCGGVFVGRDPRGALQTFG